MISHHHRCVFIHIPKNAGQSVEQVFLDQLGLSYETRAPLLMRPNDKPELGPPRLAHLKWHQYVGCKYMTQDQFDSYFKFAIVRNPWDRAVSLYRYYRFQEKCSFKEFVMDELRGWMWRERQWFVGPQADFICDSEGRLRVDFLGRFETLHSDFLRICERIGLPAIDIPHVNVSISRIEPQKVKTSRTAGPKLKPLWRRRRTVRFPIFPSFREYYDDESRALIEDLYAQDVERFGYRFDDSGVKAAG